MKKLNLITTLLALLIVLMGCKKECTFVYSAWTSCSNSIQTRTYTSSPSGCSGTPPADSTQRSCVFRKIGNQIWTLKNLDVATYRNGDVIQQAKNGNDWGIAGVLKIGAWCYYDNDSSNGTTYGKLYNWYAVNDPRGLAPTGYHIPTDAEWTTLATYLGGERVAGRKMKESGTSHWRFDEFTDATNSSGFTGLPGGGFNNMVFLGFGHMNAYGFWWSSSEFNTGNAWSRDLCYAFDSASRNNDSKQNGYSVRCIKD